MIVWTARIAATLAVVLALALGVQTWRLNRADALALQVHAKIQAEQLIAAGWQEAYKASEAEIARVVPELHAQIAALRKAEAKLAGASHWTGGGAAIPVPCIVNMGPPAGTSTPAPHPAPLDESGAPPIERKAAEILLVTPHVKIDDAVSLDDAGGVYVARKVQARLSVGETWASEWQPVTVGADSTTAVDPAIAAAWKAFKNPPPRVGFIRSPKLWRAGVSCGIGAGYGLVARGVDIGAYCLYGVQF